MAAGLAGSALAMIGLAAALVQQQPEIAPSDLTPELREQARCAMLAGVLVEEKRRGANDGVYAPPPATAKALGDALHAELSEKYGAGESATRGLLKVLYEEFTLGAAEQGPVWAEGQITSCVSRWQSAGQDSPAPPGPYGEPVDGFYCYALNSVFADATASHKGNEAGVSQHFRDKAEKVAERLRDESGGSPSALAATDVAMAAEADAFDVQAFDALPEVEAETIMLWCDGFARLTEPER